MWAFCNDDAVREAIHAEPISRIGSFDECTNGDRIHYTHNVPSMLPIHADLISRGELPAAAGGGATGWLVADRSALCRFGLWVGVKHSFTCAARVPQG